MNDYTNGSYYVKSDGAPGVGFRDAKARVRPRAAVTPRRPRSSALTGLRAGAGLDGGGAEWLNRANAAQ